MTFTLTDFGGVPNTGADQTPAFMAARAALSAAGGGTLRVPVGTWHADLNDLQWNDAVIGGEGMGASILKRFTSDANGVILGLGNPNNLTQRVTLRDITIDGDRAHLRRTGLKLQNATYTMLERVEIKGCTRYGIHSHGGANSQVWGSKVLVSGIGAGGDGTTGHGLFLDAQSNAFTFEDLSVTGTTGPALWVRGSYMVTVRACIQACAGGPGVGQPWAVNLHGGGWYDLDLYCEANAPNLLNGADVNIGSFVGDKGTVSVGGYFYGSGTCENAIRAGASRSVEVKAGTSFGGYSKGGVFIESSADRVLAPHMVGRDAKPTATGDTGNLWAAV